MGSSGYCNATYGVGDRSFGSTRIKITSNTTYKIEHFCVDAYAPDGLGVNTNTGEPEVYTQVTVTDLAIVGGTGTAANTNIYGTAKAWGSVDSGGTLSEGTNIASVTKSATGTYDVVFTTPFPTNTYSVSTGFLSGSTGSVNITTKTTTGFTAYTYNPANNAPLDRAFNFTVHDNTPAEVALTTFGDVINYSGPSAWGRFEGDGSFLAGQNIASVTRDATGLYSVVFTTPMPNANYAVTSTNNSNNTRYIRVSSITATGFTLVSTNVTTGDISDGGCGFAVHATNALPPKGGTGTDAWGVFDGSGSGTLPALSSFNVASITKTGTGVYDVVFTTPMPNANYAVNATVSDNPAINRIVCVDQLNPPTTAGFTLQVAAAQDGSAKDSPRVSFNVNATNATLPLTVTQDQIESAINNPGASAWGNVAADGTINGGMNIASVVVAPNGNEFDITFSTPMPDANYSLTMTSYDAPSEGRSLTYEDKTASGFSVVCRRTDTGAGASPTDFSFVVFATNALPPKGGTGTDSWGTVDKTTVNGPCNVPASFNVESVTRTGTGLYDVVFTTPMPTANYAVSGATNEANAASTFFYNKTTSGFSAGVFDMGTLNNYTDKAFAFTVNATNAQLPDTFTIEQFNDLVARVTALENA